MHETCFGLGPYDRVGQAYGKCSGSYQGCIGENAAGGTTTAFSTVAIGWLCEVSAQCVYGGHRRQIMKTQHTEMGAGYQSSGNKRFWIQDFGNAVPDVAGKTIYSGAHLPHPDTQKVEFQATYKGAAAPTSPVVNIGGSSYTMTLALGVATRGVYVYVPPTTVTSCAPYYFDFDGERYPESGTFNYVDGSCTTDFTPAPGSTTTGTPAPQTTTGAPTTTATTGTVATTTGSATTGQSAPNGCVDPDPACTPFCGDLDYKVDKDIDPLVQDRGAWSMHKMVSGLVQNASASCLAQYRCFMCADKLRRCDDAGGGPGRVLPMCYSECQRFQQQCATEFPTIKCDHLDPGAIPCTEITDCATMNLVPPVTDHPTSCVSTTGASSPSQQVSVAVRPAAWAWLSALPLLLGRTFCCL
jgi:hypothetical protein